MTPAITDERFGAWVLKCNPRTWDLPGFLADGGDVIEDWSVQNNYRSARMRLGDPVVLWVTGSAHASLAPGVWGVGHVTAPVNVEVKVDDDETPASRQQSADDDEAGVDYWLDLEARARARFFVMVDLPLLEVPVARERVAEDPALADMELLRQPQMSNPSWLTKDEWGALQRLLGENALKPADPADVADWNRDAEIQQPDPTTRRIVEAIAVAEIRGKLESEGWQIEDVQSENVGCDLTARRGGRVRHIEVKGRAQPLAIVQLTANEVRAAGEQIGWELAVVTDALNAPKVSWHSAQTVTAAATPIIYRAALG